MIHVGISVFQVFCNFYWTRIIGSVNQYFFVLYYLKYQYFLSTGDILVDVFIPESGLILIFRI